jgi:hypothetical protein
LRRVRADASRARARCDHARAGRQVARSRGRSQSRLQRARSTAGPTRPSSWCPRPWTLRSRAATTAPGSPVTCSCHRESPLRARRPTRQWLVRCAWGTRGRPPHARRRGLALGAGGHRSRHRETSHPPPLSCVSRRLDPEPRGVLGRPHRRPGDGPHTAGSPARPRGPVVGGARYAVGTHDVEGRLLEAEGELVPRGRSRRGHRSARLIATAPPNAMRRPPRPVTRRMGAVRPHRPVTVPQRADSLP